MRLKTLRVALAGMFLLGQSAQSGWCQNAQWRAFSPPKGDLTVLMPGKPTEEKEIEKTEAGPVTTYTCTLDRAPIAYIVGYSDFPAAVSLLPSRALLDDFRDGMIEGEGEKHKVLGERSVSLKGHPGKAIKFRDKGNLVYTSRIYLVKSRMYHMLTATAKEDEIAAAGAVAKFLDSFDLTGEYHLVEQTATWNKFSSAQGGFAVVTPGKPTYEKKITSGPSGPKDTHVFTHIGGFVMYMMTYQDFSEVEAETDPNELLDGFRTGMLKGANKVWDNVGAGKSGSTEGVNLLSERSIFLQKWPGREIKFTDPSGLVYKTRLYLVKRRMYVITAATAQERESTLSNSMEKFLESFELLEKPPQDAVARVELSTRQMVAVMDASP